VAEGGEHAAFLGFVLGALGEAAQRALDGLETGAPSQAGRKAMSGAERCGDRIPAQLFLYLIYCAGQDVYPLRAYFRAIVSLPACAVKGGTSGVLRREEGEECLRYNLDNSVSLSAPQHYRRLRRRLRFAAARALTLAATGSVSLSVLSST